MQARTKVKMSLPKNLVSDDYFADSPTQSGYSSMIVGSSGAMTIVTAEAEVKYICVYPLV
jgi:hypothetical protein